MRRNSSFDSVLLRVNSERLLITGHSPFQFYLATDAYSWRRQGDSVTFASPAAPTARQRLLDLLHLFRKRFDGLVQFVVVQMIERTHTADLLPVDEHPVLFADQFERTIGNVALVGVVARGIALPVENRHHLHR